MNPRTVATSNADELKYFQREIALNGRGMWYHFKMMRKDKPISKTLLYAAKNNEPINYSVLCYLLNNQPITSIGINK